MEKSKANVWLFDEKAVPLRSQFGKWIADGGIAQLVRASDS